MKRLRKGVRRKRRALQAYVSVGGVFYSETFPLETPDHELDAWIADTRAEALRQYPKAQAGTLAADAKRYLKAVQAMPSIKTRVSEIGYWVARFGHRPRRSLRADEIRTVRDEWILAGVAASTINHRLRALSNLYRVLDAGRRYAHNPVRQVPEVDEPDPEPRGLPYALVTAILALMPDRGKPTRGEPRPTISLAKIRARVLAWTGMAPATLKRVRETQIDWTQGTVLLGRRKKGKGARAVRLPLNAAALAAFTDLKRVQAFGAFDTPAVNRAFRRAVKQFRRQLATLAEDDPTKRADVDALLALTADVTLKDLRHSFGTAMFSATDLKTTQLFLQHGNDAQTLRYALRAVDPKLREAEARFSALTAADGTLPAKAVS